MSEARQRTLDVLEALVELLVQPREDLPLSSRTDERNQQLAESLARRFGLLPPLPLEDDMAIVTLEIGTLSRDYSTVTAWEADWDNGALYASGDTARGLMYADSVFSSEYVEFNGGATVGLASKQLLAADGERHDGTAGTGVQMASTTLRVDTAPMIIDGIEINGSSSSFQGMIAARGNSTNGLIVTRCLVHGGGASNVSGMILRDARRLDVLNTIVYGGSSKGVSLGGGFGRYARASNVTVYDCTIGIASNDATGVIVSNVISTGNSVADYAVAAPVNADYQYNLSSDATASGTGSLTSKTAANQFVSIVGGSEDLHLKTGADAIDAGTDLGTTPTGVNIDIDGRDRDLQGDTWDMGADEYVAAGGGGGEGAAVQYYNQLTMQVLR